MKSPIPRYSILASELTRVLDQGHSMSIDEVNTRVDDGSLLDWLAHDLDLSLYDAGERRTICTEFEQLANAYSSSDCGISHNGLALVLSYYIEIMQNPEPFAD